MDENERKRYKEELKVVRECLEQLETPQGMSDLNLIIFKVRDLWIVEDAGLADLAWALYEDAYISVNDVKPFLEDILAYAKKEGID